MYSSMLALKQVFVALICHTPYQQINNTYCLLQLHILLVEGVYKNDSQNKINRWSKRVQADF